MHKNLAFVVAFFGCFVLLHFAPTSNSGLRANDSKITVIFLHGKGGWPDRRDYIELQEEFQDAGLTLLIPEMPWSRDRRFDQSYQESLVKIRSLLDSAKASGAEKILLGGHSLGGNVALGYGAMFGNIDGIIASAPAHNVEYLNTLPKIQKSVEKARKMIANGQGESTESFSDLNQFQGGEYETTATIYNSFYSMDGPALGRNTRQLKPGIPVLWIKGDRDKSARRAAQQFRTLPHHPKHRFIENSGGHRRTANRSISEIIEWIKKL